MKKTAKLILLAAFLVSLEMIFVHLVMARHPASLPEPESLATVVNGEGPVVSVDPLTSTVARGAICHVVVMVEGAENRLAGYDFKMDFNPAVVQVQDVEDGGFLGSLGRTVETDGPIIEAGTVSFEAYSKGSAPAPFGSGRLAVVTLRAIGEAEDRSDLDLYEVQLTDIGGAVQPIDNLGDGVVVVTPFTGEARVFAPMVVKGYVP